MRILDLDLDFFISDIAHFISSDSDRLDDEDYKPWGEKETRAFLEEKCGLSKLNPVKGRVIKHHDEAFFFWRELINKNLLEPPFEVIHVDAHADLGLGDASWAYILSDLLSLPPAERINPKTNGMYGLGFGNYLAFSIACRWISHLTFVLHPKWENDLPFSLLKDFDDSSGAIQLKLFDKKDIDVDRIRKAKPISVEPEVPLKLQRYYDYVTREPFDYIILCQSPGYTPSSADKLIPIIEEYINQV